MIIDKVAKRRTAGEYQSSLGYFRRQKWTHPVVAAAGNIKSAMTLIASVTQTYLKNTYSFTVTSAAATKGAVYTDGVTSFTVLQTIAGATTLLLTTAATATKASGTLTKVSGTGDATITFSAHGVTSAIAQPEFPRTVTITPTKGSGSAITGNVTIVGTDIRNNAVTDVIACANDTVAVEGVVAFKTISSITVPARTQANDAITVEGGTKLGLDRLCVGNEAIYATVDGVKEGTLPIITASATDISLNLVLINTALANTKVFVLGYISTEITADNHTTA